MKARHGSSVTEHPVYSPGTFVFPRTDTSTGTLMDNKRAGYFSYVVTALGIDPAHQNKLRHLVVLWQLGLTQKVHEPVQLQLIRELKASPY